MSVPIPTPRESPMKESTEASVVYKRQVLVAAFVALYPLLDCGPGGCPEVSQASDAAHALPSTACLAALVAGSLAGTPIFLSFLGQHGFTY